MSACRSGQHPDPDLLAWHVARRLETGAARRSTEQRRSRTPTSGQTRSSYPAVGGHDRPASLGTQVVLNRSTIVQFWAL